MDDQLKQQIKQYLKENLTFENQTTSDIYEIHPDQIDLTIKLEGEVIATTKIYPLDSY